MSMASRSALLERVFWRNWGLERRGAGVLRQRKMGRRAANRIEFMVAALTGVSHDGWIETCNAEEQLGPCLDDVVAGPEASTLARAFTAARRVSPTG